MNLRRMTNQELFPLYDTELVLRLRNKKNLSDTRRMLDRFHQYLNGYPPSPELAKSFLAQFADKKPRTLYRYAQMIKVFMKWYGEPIDDYKVKIPRSLPSYHDDDDINKLISAFENKKTHKGSIKRDVLLVVLDDKSGMRRSELSNLEKQDIHDDFLIIRESKNNKDRFMPLSPEIAQRLHEFTKDMQPDEKVFKLSPPSITMKIKQFARKAGLDEEFHCHSIRHKFATGLVERGANIKVVQELLGHESLKTTEVYLSIANNGLRDAINLLNDRPIKPAVPRRNIHYRTNMSQAEVDAMARR